MVCELGLSGGSPTTMTSVAGNTITELNNVARWIHDACLDIDIMWSDWKYLWNQYATLTNYPSGVAAGQQQLPMPTNGVRQWDVRKFRWQPNGAPAGSWQPLRCYTDRQAFLDLYDVDNAIPGPPAACTILPGNIVSFSAPFDLAYDFKGEYWQRAVELVNNTDTPMFPAEFHRVVMCRAAVMYANREDAPEIIAGLTAEHIDKIDKLQSDQLEGWEYRRSSTDRERLDSTRGGWQDLNRWMQ